MSEASLELWRHQDPTETQMWTFKQKVNGKYHLHLETYDDLYHWSIQNIAQFWEETWNFTGIKASKPYDKVLHSNPPMYPRPDFFEGALLNFSENLLYPPNIPIDPSTPAVIAATESTRETVSWSDLRERVRKCALSLSTLNIKPHDRIAGFLANHTDTLVVMLAAASLGAIWTGVSPDTGVGAVLDRLVQIEPVLLFVDNAVEYNGRIHDGGEKVRDIVKGIPGLKGLVVFDTVAGHDCNINQLSSITKNAWTYHDFLKLARNPSDPLIFTQLPPSHPLYILYSSGTTGKPKCIIHSSLGTLIQHKKEHILHCDIRPADRLFYFTTCTWMMWHWLVSGLASGATIILYDGSPFKPHGDLSMPKLISDLRITHFGTSAKYLTMLEQKSVTPLTSAVDNEKLDLSCLKAIYSTGSPLPPSTFHYIYKTFPSAINLGSITGGTDIISLFGAPSPLSPVYAGEIQVRGLGMAVAVYSSSTNTIEDLNSSEAGDLVCTHPFPSQPTTFFGPSGHDKYFNSYFSTYTHPTTSLPLWHHGDFIKLTPHANGTGSGLIMLGRSDGVLKPSGVRFGSSEIYNLLTKFFPVEVEDALCVGRRREYESDEVVVLFLKMREGKVFGGDVVERVKEVVGRELSRRHVPGVIVECEEIPVTGNGKKVEVAVKQILCGIDVKTSASVANRECLEWYREWARNN